MDRAPETQGSAFVFPDPLAIFRAATAGLLSWLVPGLGHIFIGDRKRGIVCMAAIVLTFWTGVAIGSVRGTVDPHERSLWFAAQLGAGVNVGLAYAIRQAFITPPDGKSSLATPSWVSAEIGVHYTGVAGLLNVLVILDAMSRSERRSHRRPVGERGPPGAPAT